MRGWPLFEVCRGMLMIYFMLPDAPRPQGGLLHIYNLVEELVRLGYPATIWHGAADYRSAWFASAAPVRRAHSLTLEEGDILVMPELDGRKFAHLTRDARVVMNVQSYRHVFAKAPTGETWPGAYPGWPNAVAALVNSQVTEKLARWTFEPGFPTFRVPCRVSESFRPRTKERVIAFMPRKREQELAVLIQLLRRSGRLDGWRFEPIDGLPHDRVVGLLGTAAIFLAASHHEAFGLPPAEAMASGCYVIGFTGLGGREFMLPEFCSVIEDPDVMSFADEVVRVAKAWDRDRAPIYEKADSGREFIRANYSRETMAASLSNAFSVLTAPGSPALQPHRVTVHHYSSVGQTWRRRARRVMKRFLPPIAVDAARSARFGRTDPPR